MIPISLPPNLDPSVQTAIVQLFRRAVDNQIAPFIIEYTNGTIRFRSVVNSATAFRFQQADGTTLLTIDTTNGRIIVNTSGNSLVVTSPNGTQFFVSVDNNGALTTTPV